MPRKRRVGEPVLRHKAVKILSPRRIRKEPGTDRPSNETRIHLCRTVSFAVLSGHSDLFRPAHQWDSLYDYAVHVKGKKKNSFAEAKEGGMPPGGARRVGGGSNDVEVQVRSMSTSNFTATASASPRSSVQQTWTGTWTWSN